jgi:hypothetical protein
LHVLARRRLRPVADALESSDLIGRQLELLAVHQQHCRRRPTHHVHALVHRRRLRRHRVLLVLGVLLGGCRQRDDQGRNRKE